MSSILWPRLRAATKRGGGAQQRQAGGDEEQGAQRSRDPLISAACGKGQATRQGPSRASGRAVPLLERSIMAWAGRSSALRFWPFFAPQRPGRTSFPLGTQELPDLS